VQAAAARRQRSRRTGARVCGQQTCGGRAARGGSGRQAREGRPHTEAGPARGGQAAVRGGRSKRRVAVGRPRSSTGCKAAAVCQPRGRHAEAGPARGGQAAVRGGWSKRRAAVGRPRSSTGCEAAAVCQPRGRHAEARGRAQRRTAVDGKRVETGVGERTAGDGGRRPCGRRRGIEG
jgi:hypothetical protein